MDEYAHRIKALDQDLTAKGIVLPEQFVCSLTLDNLTSECDRQFDILDETLVENNWVDDELVSSLRSIWKSSCSQLQPECLGKC